jgi:Mannosyl-glycoprotein endo-beta-N-acetylglucosaminidase
MTRRAHRISALFASLLLAACGLVANAAPAGAAVTTHTPVMGPNLLTAAQLASWYHRHNGSNQPRIPALHNSVTLLAQIFIDAGNKEGVRGDMAFVQSMLETGWLSFRNSQIPPGAYNYAGIYAYNGRQSLPNCRNGDSSPSRCMGSPQRGVKMQVQLLRSYADPRARTLGGRLISAPSDRSGRAPLWEYFGGTNCPCGKLIWASAPDYGLIIIRMYSQALAESGRAGACVPYAPPSGGPKSGSGYWQVTTDGSVYSFGSARFYGSRHGQPLAAPLIGAESVSNGKGYWLLGRDGGIFTYGAARFFGSTGGRALTKPVNGMERTRDNRGYWLVADDGGIFAFGNARFYGSMGGRRLNQPVLGMERTKSGKGYWLFASDGGVFSFGDAKFRGSLGGTRLSSPVVAMQRTASGKGYWMLTRDGRVFRFGDATSRGDIAGCANYGGAARLLVTPTGKGYWIATGNGAVIAFGDARKLGFPTTITGLPVALIRSS